MVSPVDPNRLYLDKLEDTGLALFATSLACGVVSVIVVCLRTWVRSIEGVFGTDDALMLGGLALYVVDVALGCVGAWHGLGARNEHLNATMMVEGTKYLMIWMLVYVCAMLPVKGSICMTMYRIASASTAYRVAILVLLAVIVANFFTVFVGILLLCQPVEANWNKALVAAGQGRCASMDAMIGLSYTSTAVSIATDLACAVLPGVILWNTQMVLRTKISVSIVLSFGSLACISTIVRTPYIAHYRNPTDNLLYYTGNICLWSNVETAIGLVAGSLPSLRRLVMTKVGRSQGGSSGRGGAGGGSAGPEAPLGLVTFGGSSGKPGAASSLAGAGRKRGTFRNPTDGGVSVAAVHARGDGDWRRLKDDGSSASSSGPDDKDDGGLGRPAPLGGIRADYTYDVDISRSPDAAGSIFRGDDGELLNRRN